MRAQYKKQKEMRQMAGQMSEAQKPGEDGLPVFNLYVRTKKANLWYPCGSFKGDDLEGTFKIALFENCQFENGILNAIVNEIKTAGISLFSILRNHSPNPSVLKNRKNTRKNEQLKRNIETTMNCRTSPHPSSLHPCLQTPLRDILLAQPAA